MLKEIFCIASIAVLFFVPSVSFSSPVRLAFGVSLNSGKNRDLNIFGKVNGNTGFVYRSDAPTGQMRSGPFGSGGESFRASSPFPKDIGPDPLQFPEASFDVGDEKHNYADYAESATFTQYISGPPISRTRAEFLDAGGGTHILHNASFVDKVSFGGKLFFGIEYPRSLFVGIDFGSGQRQFQQLKNHSFSTDDPNISNDMYNIHSSSTHFNVRADKYIAFGHRQSSLDIYFGIAAGIEKVTLNGHLSGASSMKLLYVPYGEQAGGRYRAAIYEIIPITPPGIPDQYNEYNVLPHENFIMRKVPTPLGGLVQVKDPKIYVSDSEFGPEPGKNINDEDIKNQKVPCAFVSTSVEYGGNEGGGGPSMVKIKNHTFSRFNISARAGLSYNLNEYSAILFGYMFTYTPSDVDLIVSVQDRPRSASITKDARLANLASISGLRREYSHSVELGAMYRY